ncbi:MAG: hypothetical protein E6Q73_16690 [Pseudorhodobacter sp.]|nr:MAG: hypothetical protein E6Q73_16690 [Pseudorhodobacter sp.]
MQSPNLIAYIALALWPVVSWKLWQRLDRARALIWTILGGYLLLPPVAAAFNFPVVPDLNKLTIPNLMALACALWLVKDKVGFVPKSWIGKALIVVYILSPFGTVLTNSDPLFFQQASIQGMRLYDSFASIAYQAIALVPFFLARRYLGTPEGMRAIIFALIAAGLAYSLPMMIEAVMSPQINVWVYGFFQHDFWQTVRYGGYRPVVFLPHGLWVAFFACMAALAALAALRRSPAEARPKALVTLLYLVAMLILCRSAGPIVYTLALTPLILLAPVRLQILIAAVMALVVITYPILRGAHLVPVDQILDFANGLSPERAYSLRFRIENEEILLARAQERPWFGWGGYGRAFTHDPVTGKTLNIADGAWVILMGNYGWVGYVTEFGLTALPLLLLAHEALRQGKAMLSPWVGAVALILGANMMDLLPNATHIPFTWLLAGALLGEAERLAAIRADAAVMARREGLHTGKPLRTVI